MKPLNFVVAKTHNNLGGFFPLSFFLLFFFFSWQYKGRRIGRNPQWGTGVIWGVLVGQGRWGGAGGGAGKSYGHQDPGAGAGELGTGAWRNAVGQRGGGKPCKKKTIAIISSRPHLGPNERKRMKSGQHQINSSFPLILILTPEHRIALLTPRTPKKKLSDFTKTPVFCTRSMTLLILAPTLFSEGGAAFFPYPPQPSFSLSPPVTRHESRVPSFASPHAPFVRSLSIIVRVIGFWHSYVSEFFFGGGGRGFASARI